MTRTLRGLLALGEAPRSRVALMVGLGSTTIVYGVEVRGEAADATGHDAVLVAAGRAPNVERLDLTAAGVRFDTKDGVTVDDHLRTTNSRVFAAGSTTASSRWHRRGSRASAGEICSPAS